MDDSILLDKVKNIITSTSIKLPIQLQNMLSIFLTKHGNDNNDNNSIKLNKGNKTRKQKMNPPSKIYTRKTIRHFNAKTRKKKCIVSSKSRKIKNYKKL
jgi:hypothetical protein